MINITCGSCGKNYKIDPKILKSQNAKFTCKQCGYVNNIGSSMDKTPIDTQDAAIKQTDSAIEQAMSHLSDKAEVDKTTSKRPQGQYQVSQNSFQVSWVNHLQIKVNAVLIPLIIVIMATFTIFSYITEKQKMEITLENLSKAASKRLSVYLVESFWSLDDETLEESLKSEMMDNNVYSINLIDRGGKIYLGYKRNPDWNIAVNNSPVQGNYVKAEESIVKDLNKIGTVEVYYSSKFFLEQFKQSVYKLIITSLLLIIAVSLATAVVINKMILSPIGRLTDIANKISIGNLDLEIPIESKDEIGLLADAFARMKVSMEFAIKQLRKR
ncbi:MAG: HAMP domain-containing protein [Desulfamplus sp.]